jgi:ubiquinone/menaquinone biosynthesis C-methylase UbiE
VTGRGSYKYALRYDAFTRLYDPGMRLAMRERLFKSKLIDLADLRDGQNILDLGCGTGTLTAMIKQRCPMANVSGLDGDPKALGIAVEKCGRRECEIEFRHGMADSLPFGDASYHCIVSSLLFHHLDRATKGRALSECFRVLKPEGRLCIADFGRSANVLMRIAFLAVQFGDGFDTTTDNVNGLLPELMRDAGFANVREAGAINTIAGTIALYDGQKN